MGTLQVKKNEKVKRIKVRCSWWSIDHHLTMKTLLRRQQVESLACGCAVSNGTAKLMVHFKRYKHWSSFNHLHHEHAGGQVHWQEGGRGEVPPASWNLLHSERTTSGDDHAGIRDQLFVLCLSNVFDIFGLERIENPGCFILSMKLIVFFPTRYAIAFVPPNIVVGNKKPWKYFEIPDSAQGPSGRSSGKHCFVDIEIMPPLNCWLDFPIFRRRLVFVFCHFDLLHVASIS